MPDLMPDLIVDLTPDLIVDLTPDLIVDLTQDLIPDLILDLIADSDTVHFTPKKPAANAASLSKGQTIN